MDGTERFGYLVNDFIRIEARSYDLRSLQGILVEKKGSVMELDLAEASNLSCDGHDLFFETLDYARSINLDVIIVVDKEFNGNHAHDAEKSLVRRLKPYKNLVKRNCQRYFDGIFDNPEYAALFAACHQPKKFGRFIELGLRVVENKARLSLDGHRPNYRIHTRHLFDDISDYIGKNISVKNIPPFIEGFLKESNNTKIQRLMDSSHYVRAIVQRNGSPFTYVTEMEDCVREFTRDMDDLGKSRAIHKWILSNITYGNKNRESSIGYQGALDTYMAREGLGRESASLQVTMERLAGNMAYLVKVGKNHVCAAHLRPSGKMILIDTLIDTTKEDGFDIKHDKFEILPDDESGKYFF